MSADLTFRQRYVSRPVLNWIRGVLPAMSETEREALDAGTIGWEADLLRGDPDFSKLLGAPTRQPNAEEQAFIDGPTEELCRLIDDWKITFEHRDIPGEIWDFIKAHGFLGLVIPKQYGGKGFSATANSAIVMKIASRGPSAAVAVIVPNSLGPGELLMLFGTEEQKDHWLPRLADGRDIPAFALTSLDAGSDAASMTDSGVVCWGEEGGARTLGMRVSWSKRYISLAPICTVLGLAFKLADPDGLLGGAQDLGITVALVPTDTPGVATGERHYPALQAFPNGPTSGTDVFIPLDRVIGGPTGVGQGWKMLVTALAAGRGIMLPAMAQAGMKVAAFSTGAYGRIREQFNLPLTRFEGIQEVAARIAGEAYKMDAARRLTLAAIDAGEKPAVVSAIMKYQATERLRRTINDAMDVHAGKAVIDGPKNYLASTYRAIPIAITVEGANIMTRSLMIYGQGSVRCHPFLQQEIEAANNPDRNEAVRDFDALLGRHAGYALKVLALAIGRAWTAGLVAGAPVDGPTARYFRQVKRLSAALALVSEAAIVTLGGALKRKEMISARFGDALSELYLVSAMLKHYEEADRPADELALLDYACRSSFNAAEEALNGVIVNFPVRPVGWALKLALQPFGVVCRPPRDRLARTVSDIIAEPGAARDRLTAGIYIGEETELGRLDRAFRLMAELEPVRQKMRKARLHSAEEAEAAGILSPNEAASMGQALGLVREVLEVDRFASEDLTGKAAHKRPRAA
ncbi:MAG TPA: acyl-CoA dehydrogenase [Aestuariivirgaceae bacterium]|nr:acyl-CoA dehydrogenase [Aestuariivirgaceae bacterium]